jgi:hypothetical protein
VVFFAGGALLGQRAWLQQQRADDMAAFNDNGQVVGVAVQKSVGTGGAEVAGGTLTMDRLPSEFDLLEPAEQLRVNLELYLKFGTKNLVAGQVSGRP